MIKILVESIKDSNIPSWLKNDSVALRCLNKKGIDIHNMIWHKSELPSNRSAMLKDPNIIPVFGVPVLYGDGTKPIIPGICEGRVLINGKVSDSSKISWSALISITKEFGYLEVDESSKDHEKIMARLSANRYDPSVDRLNAKNKNDLRLLRRGNYDKSGYRIPDINSLLAKRYQIDFDDPEIADAWANHTQADIVRENKSLKALHNNIIRVKSEISKISDEIDNGEAMTDPSIPRSTRRSLMSNYTNMTNAYLSALNDYADLIDDLNEYIGTFTIDYSKIYFNDKINTIVDKLNRVKMYIADYRKLR